MLPSFTRFRFVSFRISPGGFIWGNFGPLPDKSFTPLAIFGNFGPLATFSFVVGCSLELSSLGNSCKVNIVWS